MKFRALIGCFVITFAILVCFSTAICQMDNEARMSTSYGQMIDHCIKKCESKAAMSYSKSKNIRKASMLAAIKMEYLRAYKEKLIQQMVEKEIQLKAYKVQYFLNKQFFIYYASNPDIRQGIFEV